MPNKQQPGPKVKPKPRPKAKSAKPDILFISGSPRTRTCVGLIDLLERGAKKAGANTQRFLLAKKHIEPCTGCGGCSKTGNCVLANKTRDGRFIDDYLELKSLLERTDAVAIVAPLYFAGPPAQLKALFDRFQPYWARRYALGEPPAPKRPAQLFIVGNGGDPHGFAPLSGIAKSALACAGFNLEKVLDFIGFKACTDVSVMPPEEKFDDYSKGELAQLRRDIKQQDYLEQRALDVGGAFARYVVKEMEKSALQAELAQVEAELAELRAAEEELIAGEAGAEAGVAAAVAGADPAALGAVAAAPDAAAAPEGASDDSLPDDVA